MIPQPENNSSRPENPPPLHWLGTFLLILGATLAAAFITRQLKEAGTGHTYYELIGGGGALAVIGLFLILSLRRKIP